MDMKIIIMILFASLIVFLFQGLIVFFICEIIRLFAINLFEKKLMLNKTCNESFFMEINKNVRSFNLSSTMIYIFSCAVGVYTNNSVLSLIICLVLLSCNFKKHLKKMCEMTEKEAKIKE